MGASPIATICGSAALNSTGSLAGVRVIELDADGSSGLAGRLMAQQGADVVLVEPPEGHPLRHAGPFVDDEPHPDRSLSFWAYSTNKRSIVLDLDRRDGVAALRRLTPGADVLLETQRPGWLEEHGLSPAELWRENPGLVVTRLTPYGQDGPWRDYLGADLTLLASGGELYLCGYADHAIPPIRPAGNQAWHLGAHHALLGTLMALVERQASGLGQVVDVAIHDAVAGSLEMVTPAYHMRGEICERQEGRYAAPIPTTPTVAQAMDGKWLSFYTTPNERSWAAMVAWMAETGHEAFLDDPRYVGDYPARRADLDAIHAVINEFVASKPAEEIYLRAQAIGLPWGTVRSPEEAVEDPHFRARGSLVEVEHEELGRTVLYPGAPAILSETPFAVSRAPLQGEHTEVVLREFGALGAGGANGPEAEATA